MGAGLVGEPVGAVVGDTVGVELVGGPVGLVVGFPVVGPTVGATVGEQLPSVRYRSSRVVISPVMQRS